MEDAGLGRGAAFAGADAGSVVAAPEGLRYRGAMSRFIGALGIAAVSGLVGAIFSLLFAVLVVGGDDAVWDALIVAGSIGLLALPVAWWLLGWRRLRAVPDTRAAHR